VRHGGRKEYEAVRNVHDKPKTPTSRISAMYISIPGSGLCRIDCCIFRLAMGSTEDPGLMQETFQFILSKAKDQDVVHFFQGLSSNFKTRRLLVRFFKDEYNQVNVGGDDLRID
jgi:aminopeptidase 2